MQLASCRLHRNLRMPPPNANSCNTQLAIPDRMRARNHAIRRPSSEGSDVSELVPRFEEPPDEGLPPSAPVTINPSLLLYASGQSQNHLRRIGDRWVHLICVRYFFEPPSSKTRFGLRLPRFFRGWVSEVGRFTRLDQNSANSNL